VHAIDAVAVVDDPAPAYRASTGSPCGSATRTSPPPTSRRLP